jgi:hypothetical protein
VRVPICRLKIVLTALAALSLTAGGVAADPRMGLRGWPTFGLAAPLPANWSAQPARFFPSGGPLSRYTHDMGSQYALFRILTVPDQPLLILLDPIWADVTEVRILDDLPWSNPRVAQRLVLEPRQIAGHQMLGAWVMPLSEPCSGAHYLLVTASAGAGPADLDVELFDPSLPYPPPRLARAWSYARADDLPTPLQRNMRENVQAVGPAGPCPRDPPPRLLLEPPR